MRNDTRLSRMLHVLIHMARHEGPATSEAIGQMLGTNRWWCDGPWRC